MQSYGIAKSSTFSRIENGYVALVQDSGLILISTNNYSVNMNMKLSFLCWYGWRRFWYWKKEHKDIYGSTIIYKMYIYTIYSGIAGECYYHIIPSSS